MRSLLLAGLLLPVLASAQINRSAREFAGEQISEYISSRLFKDLSYKPVFLGELNTAEENSKEIAWSIQHRFEITDTVFQRGGKQAVTRPYSFVFYMDKKMIVKRAETFEIR